MAAIANAIERATGRRLTELPMSPQRVLAAIEAGGQT
jgi:xanthine dehydrogenase YagR molybdenum-binding subunit